MIRLKGTALSSMLAITLLLAVPQIAGSIGQCRKGPNCGAPELKCDQAALDKAKADYDRWWGVYKDQSEIADNLWEEASEAGDKLNELFEEKLGPVDLVIDIIKDAKIHIIAEGVGKIGGEHLAEVFGRDVAIVSIAKFLLDMGILDAKMLTLLKDMDGYASQAEEAADAALQSLQKAIAAHERMEALAKQCTGTNASGPKSDNGSNDDDGWKSSAQKEAEAAQKLLDSWRKVEGGYEDANGDFHDAELARQEALDIVQSQEHSMEPNPSLLVSDVSSYVAHLRLASAGDKLSPNKLQKFIKVMGRGFAKLADGTRKADSMRMELQKIGQLRGGQKSR